MPRVHVVEKARKARPEAGIEVGDRYFYWTKRSGPYTKGRTYYSKTYPKPSQLTGSAFLQSVYALQEEMSAYSPDSDLESVRDDWAQRIREIGEECQEKLDNMPEGLQQGSTGELLQERIDAMENWASEIEGVNIPDRKDYIEAEDDGEDEDDTEDAENRYQSALDEAYSEITGADPGV